eukprot:TRINITY_DN46778_c0_g1_i1.p1 TRINITY_DN46778_c0_g1~~TRINITY_DN46778_c0_g1_i1.p1  ORF type:complete len:496 (+),score=152.68 TRINITY_DN46778_c0_g1_i1:65-1489(+)
MGGGATKAAAQGGRSRDGSPATSPVVLKPVAAAAAAPAPGAARGGDSQGTASDVASPEAREAAELKDRENDQRIQQRQPNSAYLVAPVSQQPPSPDVDWKPGQALRVWCGTWNMEGGGAPKKDAPGGQLSDFIPAGGGGFHILAVVTQECLRTIAKSFLQSDKSEWEDALQAHLGDGYIRTGCHTLMATHIVVFVRDDVMQFVDPCRVASAHFSTGLAGGAVGNKGGVGVSMCIAAGEALLSVLFVGAHFHAHQGAVDARNADYDAIVGGLPLGTQHSDPALAPPPRSLPDTVGRVAGPSTRPIRDVTDEFDLVWFMGDFNYRVDGTRGMVDTILGRSDLGLDILLANDQLRQQMTLAKCFRGFREGPITFPPTYKYARDKVTGLASDQYETKKMRIPSWCDRIVFKQHADMLARSGGRDLGVQLMSYRAVDALRLSDHRPVVAAFQVLTPKPKPGSDAKPPQQPPKSSTCVLQ